jgi:hypothetical protein
VAYDPNSKIFRPDFLPPAQLPWQAGMNPDQPVNIQPAATAFKDRFMSGGGGNGPAAPDHAQPEIPLGPQGHGLGPANPDIPMEHGIGLGTAAPLAKLGAGKGGGMASL